MARTTGTHTKATGTITSTKNYADADTILIGNVTYRLKSSMAQANDVKLGANEAATIAAIVKAINGTGVALTDYYTGTATVPAVVASSDGAHVITLTARLGGTHGNNIHLAEGTDSGTAYSITRAMSGGAGALHTFIADLLDYEQTNSELLQDLLHIQNAAAGA